MNSLRPLYTLSLLVAGIAVVPAHAAIVSDPAPPAGIPDTGPSAALVALSTSADGSLVYTLDKNGELFVRDINTKKTTFRGSLDPGSGITKMRVLKGGSLLVGFKDGGVRLYSKPIAGKPLVSPHLYFIEPLVQAPDAKTQTSIGFSDFALSPDGSLLAIQTLEHAVTRSVSSRPVITARVRVWKLGDDKTPLEITSVPADNAAPQLGWSDGKTLVVARPEVAIQRFDAANATVLSEWKPPASAAPKIDQAKADAEFERRVQTLPPAMQERARTAHERSKNRAVDANAATQFGIVRGVSNDGRLVVSSNANGLLLWDSTDNSTHLLEKSERLGSGGEVLFSPDNQLIALNSGGAFWMWKTDGAQVGMASVPLSDASEATFSPDGTSILMALDTGDVRVWKTTAPITKTPSLVMPGFFQRWNSIQATDAGLFASTSRGVALVDPRGDLRWYGPAPLPDRYKVSAAFQSQLRVNVDGFAAASDGKTWVEAVSFSPYYSALTKERIPRGEVYLRETSTGKYLWSIAQSGDGGVVSLVRFLTPDTVLTGGRGYSMRVRPLENEEPPPGQSFVGLNAWDATNGNYKDLGIQWGDKNGLTDPGIVEILETAGNGKRFTVSSGGGGNGLQTIDLDAKQVISYFGENSDVAPRPWALSNAGRFLAGPYRGGVGLWDVSKARKPYSSAPDIHLPTGEGSKVTALSWSKDDSLAAGTADGRVLCWTPEYQTDKAPAWETAPARAITALTWSRDGQTLSIGDERGDLKTRDAQTGTLKTTLRLLPPSSETTPLRSIRWTSDGKITPAKP